MAHTGEMALNAGLKFALQSILEGKRRRGAGDIHAALVKSCSDQSPLGKKKRGGTGGRNAKS